MKFALLATLVCLAIKATHGFFPGMPSEVQNLMKGTGKTNIKTQGNKGGGNWMQFMKGPSSNQPWMKSVLSTVKKQKEAHDRREAEKKRQKQTQSQPQGKAINNRHQGPPQRQFKQGPPQQQFKQGPPQQQFKQGPPQQQFKQGPPQQNFNQAQPQQNFNQGSPQQQFKQGQPQQQFKQGLPQQQFKQAPPQQQFKQGPPQQQFKQGPPQQQFNQGPPQQNFNQGSPQPKFNQAQPPPQNFNKGPPQQPNFNGNHHNGKSASFQPQTNLNGQQKAGPQGRHFIFQPNQNTNYNQQQNQWPTANSGIPPQPNQGPNNQQQNFWPPTNSGIPPQPNQGQVNQQQNIWPPTNSGSNFSPPPPFNGQNNQYQMQPPRPPFQSKPFPPPPRRFPYIAGECKPGYYMCEFSLIIQNYLTNYNNDNTHVSLNSNRQVIDSTTGLPVSEDGLIYLFHNTQIQNIKVVNGSLPGPPIRVYAGQHVAVHVTNLMLSDSTSIHFHGQDLRGTPWADGTPYISQCPVGPGQTFTYRFRAGVPGTSFYKSQLGTQIASGVFGAFVVLDRTKNTTEQGLAGDFELMLSNWNKNIQDPEMTFLLRDWGDENRSKFTNILINGRDGLIRPTRFTVEPNKRYKFRVIGAHSENPLTLRFHRHKLSVVASDGFDIEPVTVDILTVWPGERYDVILETDRPPDNYQILAKYPGGYSGVGVLSYNNTPIANVNSDPSGCTGATPCVILNCLSPSAVENAAIFTCISLNDLRNKYPVFPPHAPPMPFPQVFLNFVIAGDQPESTVNARRFISPTVATLTTMGGKTYCDPHQCRDNTTCKCTSMFGVPSGTPMQFVFVNQGNNTQIRSVHVHGYHFHVLKVEYNSSSTDISCAAPVSDISLCRRLQWSNENWNRYWDNVPGLNFNRTILKDTIYIPPGGYVVARIFADNAGAWEIHSTDLHEYISGMSIVMRVGVPGRDYKTPPDLPSCSNYEAGIHRFFSIPDVLRDRSGQRHSTNGVITV